MVKMWSGCCLAYYLPCLWMSICKLRNEDSPYALHSDFKWNEGKFDSHLLCHWMRKALALFGKHGKNTHLHISTMTVVGISFNGKI